MHAFQRTWLLESEISLDHKVKHFNDILMRKSTLNSIIHLSFIREGNIFSSRLFTRYCVMLNLNHSILSLHFFIISLSLFILFNLWLRFHYTVKWLEGIYSLCIYLLSWFFLLYSLKCFAHFTKAKYISFSKFIMMSNI